MPLAVITAWGGSSAVNCVQNQQNMYKRSNFASLWWENSSQKPEPFMNSQRFPSPTSAPGEFPSHFLLMLLFQEALCERAALTLLVTCFIM